MKTERERTFHPRKTNKFKFIRRRHSRMGERGGDGAGGGGGGGGGDGKSGGRPSGGDAVGPASSPATAAVDHVAGSGDVSHPIDQSSDNVYGPFLHSKLDYCWSVS